MEGEGAAYFARGCHAVVFEAGGTRGDVFVRLAHAVAFEGFDDVAVVHARDLVDEVDLVAAATRAVGIAIAAALESILERRRREMEHTEVCF